MRRCGAEGFYGMKLFLLLFSITVHGLALVLSLEACVCGEGARVDAFVAWHVHCRRGHEMTVHVL